MWASQSLQLEKQAARKAVYLCWSEKISHVKAADSTVSKTKDIKPL